MNRLSSHSLFHFTRKYETLISILKKGLRYSPIGEKIPNTSLYYIVDAVCFCDIPLGSIDTHCEWYGKYGIGLKPSYCKGIGATPISYAHPQTNYLFKGRKRMEYYENNPHTAYIKAISGTQRKYHCAKYQKKYFYDEKEWRSISGKVYIYDSGLIKNKQDLCCAVMDNIKSRKVKDWFFASPMFRWQDIDYIILEKKREVQKMLNWMKKNHLPLYLHQRIFTIEQLQTDF